MLNIKNQKISNEGFTLIELMVVVTIMVMLATVMVINLAGQRTSRDIKIAQNQLVSYIRQAQSYTLSARILPSGESVQFYVLKFDLNKPTQYTLEAVYNVSSAPQLQDIQTINLPPNIQIATITPASYPIAIDRSSANDAVNQPGNSTYLQTPNCALIAFAAPFGKVIFNGGCSQSQPPWDQNNDDYEKIVNFQTNVACTSFNNPPTCSASTDSLMTITLSDSRKTISKTVTVNAVTGLVTFN
jgi:prepilin-type N-terminal cleavage/methylation domain-containing protein